MSRGRKTLRNVLVGVAIGAGISLLDKENREKISRKGKKLTKKITEWKEDPQSVKDVVKSQLKVVQSSVEKLEDNVQSVKDKWIEIKDSVPGFKSPKSAMQEFVQEKVVEKVEEKVLFPSENKQDSIVKSSEATIEVKDETDAKLKEKMEEIFDDVVLSKNKEE
ncbi:YtxH domain-containing protein [Bacillus sp. RG28]|uniref:YtxH domain-containing protein n=1 Tax=Gottfriedia endophytica TaxID=2820819 RepID=A0A940NIL5_9BACI|nr:YtxH domain-containing protein [Gottfriedia endophytica]MBP0726054.1 YtxH domain-containing protein [Gottfriedia endophytica]